MSRRGWALFVALSVIWGIPYLFIKVAVQDLSPAAVVFGRTALAALLLLPLAAARRQLRPLLPAAGWLLVFALLEVCAPFGLLSVAEQHISSSLTGLLVAAVPLIQALISRLLGLGERLDAGRMVGLLVGLAGVAALVGIDVRGSNLLAALAVVLAAACYATGPLVATLRLAHLSSMAVSAVAMVVSAVLYAPLAWITRPAGRLDAVSPAAWAAVGVLGIVCSALAFLVFFALLAEVGPARTTVITYVNPAVAVVLGVLTLGEPVTAGLVLGFPLVLLGSYLATRRSPPADHRAGGDAAGYGELGRENTPAELPAGASGSPSAGGGSPSTSAPSPTSVSPTSVSPSSAPPASSWGTSSYRRP
ncbi:MAG TPA: EamA family transporter [Kineosporiaceae bacterium]|nr:EamA family transporter [Kineosporiaceae bacterium]